MDVKCHLKRKFSGKSTFVDEKMEKSFYHNHLRPRNRNSFSRINNHNYLFNSSSSSPSLTSSSSVTKMLSKIKINNYFFNKIINLYLIITIILFIFQQNISIIANATANITNDRNNSKDIVEQLDKSESILLPSSSSKSSFKSPTKDGDYNDLENYQTSTTTSTSTTVKDIRKLLEDYVRYLANLPDITKANDNDHLRKLNENDQYRMKSQQDIISTAESNDENKSIQPLHQSLNTFHTFVPIINHPSSRGEYVYHHHDHPYDKHHNHYDKQKKVTVNLTDKDLSSFIDSVLGTVKTRKNPSQFPISPATPPTNIISTTTTTESPLINIDDDLEISNNNNNNDTTDINNNNDDDVAIDELMAYIDPKNNNNNNNDNYEHNIDDVIEEDDVDDDINDDSISVNHHLQPNADNKNNTNSSMLQRETTTTIQPITMEITTTTVASTTTSTTTTNDPLSSSSSKMLQTNNKLNNDEHIADEEICDIDLQNGVENNFESTSTTTIKPMMIKNNINNNSTKNNIFDDDVNDDGYHKHLLQSSSKQQNLISNSPIIEVNQNDLLEQLKRTRELLSIQIEKLKTLEHIVFGRKDATKLSSLLFSTEKTTERNVKNDNYDNDSVTVSDNNKNSHQYRINDTITLTTESPLSFTTESSSSSSNNLPISKNMNETLTTTITTSLATEYLSATTTAPTLMPSSTIKTNTGKNISTAVTAAAITIQPQINYNNDGIQNGKNVDMTPTTVAVATTTTTENPLSNEKSFNSIIQKISDNSDDNNYNNGINKNSNNHGMINSENSNADIPFELIEPNNINFDNENNNHDTNESQIRKINNDNSDPKFNSIRQTNYNNDINDKKSIDNGSININKLISTSTIKPSEMMTTTKSTKSSISRKDRQSLANNNDSSANIMIPIINSSIIEPSSSFGPSSSSMFGLDEPNSVVILSNSNANDDIANLIDSQKSTNTDHGNDEVNKPNNNNNIENNENFETMILTHVPKITIIHKILKPYRSIDSNNNNNNRKISDSTSINNSSNNNNANDKLNNRNYLFESDENLSIYQEALKRHQNLIRSTMSSMSLYPASIKHYRIKNTNVNNSNNNLDKSNQNSSHSQNRINSFGEIYLLPNFITPKLQDNDSIDVADEKNLTNQTPLVFVPVTLTNNNNNDDDDNSSMNLSSEEIFDSNFKNDSNIMISDLLLQNLNQTLLSKSINLDNKNQIGKIIKTQEPAIIAIDDNNGDKNDSYNDDHIMIPRNKFKSLQIEMNPYSKMNGTNQQHNSNNNRNQSSSQYQHQRQQPKPIILRNQLKNKRPKLLLTNPQTLMAINRNPGNILRLYRPRFKLRKRFRKIRLPNNNNLIINNQPNVVNKEHNATIHSVSSVNVNTNQSSLSINDGVNIFVVDKSPLTLTSTTMSPLLSSVDEISAPENNNNNKTSIRQTTFSPEIESEIIDSFNHTTINNFYDKITLAPTTSTESASRTTTMEPPTTKLIMNETISIVDKPENKNKNNNINLINIVPADVFIANGGTGSNSSNDITKSINNNNNNNNNDNNRINNFKVFCTYDAYRSIPSFLNQNETKFNRNKNGKRNDNYENGRYFDIDQLEQNSIFLKYCTHLIYSFVNINLNGELYIGMNQIHQDNSNIREYNQQCLVRIQKLKENNPHLKLLAAIGGWDTPPQLFSLMVATQKLREHLATNIYQFIFENNFDGAIIAWFYPVYGSKSSLDSRSTRATSHSMFQFDDKQNLIKFARTLRRKFNTIKTKNRLELGLMVPPFQEFIDRGYDARKLSESVDHFILMTYDYYDSWENQVHHFSPLFAQRNNSIDERNIKYNINYTVNYWINQKHAPKNQTMIGVAFYGRSFTLANEQNANIGAASIGPGIAGPITNRPGLLSFNELCELYLGNPNVRLNEDDYRVTANLQLNNQWVGFDDELSLYLKTKYAIGKQLSGIFIWSINYDDYKNRCGWGQFPLLKAVNKAIEHCHLWKQCSPLLIKNNQSPKQQQHHHHHHHYNQHQNRVSDKNRTSLVRRRR